MIDNAVQFRAIEAVVPNWLPFGIVRAAPLPRGRRARSGLLDRSGVRICHPTEESRRRLGDFDT
jgi:hypothetical protein